MSAQDRGWGPPGCTTDQLVRITHPGLVDTDPYFPLRVRREVAPLFSELVRWLVAERARLDRPPLTSSGGYNKRLIAGSDQWSNHSWGLAGDFCADQNPMRRPLTSDMPPGTAEKASSLGMRWGGSYTGTPDPMHFEFTGTPADAQQIALGLSQEEDTMTPAQEKKLDGVEYRVKRLQESVDAVYAAAARQQASLAALEAALAAGGADQAALVDAARTGAAAALEGLTLKAEQ